MEPFNPEKCRTLLAALSEYVDGDVNESVCSEIERHLADCENCRTVVDSLRKTVQLYHNTAGESPVLPGEVRERLYRCLGLGEFLEKQDQV
jgi:predicted anti-sigma-YlaC factor YlaD